MKSILYELKRSFKPSFYENKSILFLISYYFKNNNPSNNVVKFKCL